MREDAESRLSLLRVDYQQGQARLMQLEQQAAGMREGLLRIAGAIQVLEELLANQPDETPARDGATLTVP